MTSARALLRRQLRVAHDLLEGAIAPLTQEAVDGFRDGSAARAAARFAEVAVSEDLMVNGVLTAGRPLAFTTWCGRTGLSELPRPGTSDHDGWLRRVRCDLRRARAYARAVSTATDAYLDSLADEGLPAEPACLLTALLLDLAARRGEIACLLRRANTLVG